MLKWIVITWDWSSQQDGFEGRFEEATDLEQSTAGNDQSTV